MSNENLELTSPAEPQRVGFPILRPYQYGGPLPGFVDWAILNEQQAQINHGQTLKRLAERGGLAPCEIIANIEGRRWRKMDTDEALRQISDHSFGQQDSRR